MMLRARFHANEDDWRPIKFPPPGPAWCTGYGPGFSVVVAYVENEAQIKEFWPEASSIDAEPRDEIIFTDRFARPDWWPEGKLIIGGARG